MPFVKPNPMEENLLRLDRQICFPLYALSREITQHYRPLLDELDITYPQYLVLLVMWEHKKQTVNQLGVKLRLDSGTLTPLLKRMEQKGFLRRTRSPADERVVEITLTESGRALEHTACCIPEKLAESLRISEEDLVQLYTLVTKLMAQSAPPASGKDI